MCAQRDEGSDHSISFGSVDSSEQGESFPEVVDSSDQVSTEGQSSDDAEPSTANAPPSTAPTTDVSHSDHHNQQQQQRQATRRTSRASSKLRVDKRKRSRRTQLPLREVVVRRAFECTIGARGELSKVIDLVKEGKSAALEVGEPMTESEDGSDETPGHRRRKSHGRPPSSEFQVEPVPHGADIYVGHEDTSECVWGVDLHWCDLDSFIGLPAELGSSPWDFDEEDDEEEPWRCICVYLDASLNRLRGLDVIADQPSLRELAYLDISNNLIDNLENVQDLPNLQVLMASNNQIDSVEALGEFPKGSGLRHVDLSNNSISVVEEPRSAHAFRRLKSLSLPSNHLEEFEEEAALALTSLERLDVSDNELVSIDWVALLEALRFLDCSQNRVSALPTFARALANPPRLAEVIAEGNPVTEDPQYRITILIKCKKIKRLDHRPVDAAALQRQLRCATEARVLTSVRETASKEYHVSVEGERSRLERRKSVLKAQGRRLDDAFQEYRAQKEREMGECVAYAEFLRRKGGQFLTPKVANVFQETVGLRRPVQERGNQQAAGSDSGAAEGAPGVDTSLKTILRSVVGEEHPELGRSSSGGSRHDSQVSTGDDDGSSRGSESSRHSSSDAETGGAYSTTTTTASTTATTKRRRRRTRRTKTGETERSRSSSGLSSRTSASGQAQSHGERGNGGGSTRRGVQTRADRGTASEKKDVGPKQRSGRSSTSAAATAAAAPTKKTGGGGMVRSVLGAIGWRKTAGSNNVSNSNSNASLATVGSGPQKAKS